MKNHIWQDGKLLQTNKKWSHLKQSQRAWICEITAVEHAAYIEEHSHLPMKKNKDMVANKVYALVKKREIWIPYGEFRSHVVKIIDRLNHKSPLFTPPKKKPTKVKNPIPRMGFEEFPNEVQEDVKATLARGIERYIHQTHRVPTNKVRDGEIKQVLRGFNSKKWRPYGMLMQSSDTLLSVYNDIRESIHAMLHETCTLPEDMSKTKRNRLRNNTAILETDRLTLRKMNGRDYKDIREMLADPDVMYAYSAFHIDRLFP